MLIEINALKDIKEPTCIIYKHSITCPVSGYARKLINEFVKTHEDIPVYMNIVQINEELKWAIAEKYGVKHETPQVIIIKKGKMVASASHYHIENLASYFN